MLAWARKRTARGSTSRRQLLSNSITNLAAYAVFVPVGLWVSYFTVQHVGIKGFGVWAALTTVIAFQGLLDLGVTAPLVKYVAEYVALGQEHEVNVLLSTAMVMYVAIATIFGGLLILANPWVLVHLIHGNANDPQLRVMYFAVVVGFCLALVFSVLQSLLIGLQRADVMAILTLGFNLAGAVGTVAVLEAGLGLSGLALNWVVITVITIAVNWVAAKMLFRPLRLNPFLFRWSTLRKIVRFSSKIQVSTVVLFMNNQVDRILIAYVFGRAMVGYYQLAARVTAGVYGLSASMMNGVLSASSGLAATQQRERLRTLYMRATRYQAMIILPLCAAIGGLARPFVSVWLGPGFGRVAWTLVIVLAGYAFWLPSSSTVAALNGIGRPEIRMRMDIVFIAVHVPLAVFLIWKLGYYGTILGTTFLIAGSRFYLYWAGCRVLHTRVRDLLIYSFVQPVAASAIALAVVVVMQLAVPVTFLTFVGESVAFGLVYVGYLLAVGFDSYDREIIRGFASGPLSKRILRRPADISGVSH